MGIESHVEVTVSPEDDVEIRRITLTNHGLRARKLELISAAELSLAPHDADRAHPAFSKLFIQTEALPELQALLAWRRLRSDDDPPVWVAQFIIESPADDGPFEYETDRARFLGRGRSWQNPVMSMDADRTATFWILYSRSSGGFRSNRGSRGRSHSLLPRRSRATNSCA